MVGSPQHTSWAKPFCHGHETNSSHPALDDDLILGLSSTPNGQNLRFNVCPSPKYLTSHHNKWIQQQPVADHPETISCFALVFTQTGWFWVIPNMIEQVIDPWKRSYLSSWRLPSLDSMSVGNCSVQAVISIHSEWRQVQDQTNWYTVAQ